MVEGSLDIESIPIREVREYTVERGSVYTQTRQYDKKGNLEKEIWEGTFSKRKIILDDAVYISNEKYDLLVARKFNPLDIIQIAKKEGYKKLGGLIVLLYQRKPYLSSEVTKIEPPFEKDAAEKDSSEEDFPITA
ncbi:MAG: hypothetical protein Q8N63_08415 [Nanoarchaeota archaeon]|nr:hypothetical protein [Nanoarchaeota archaeon]